MPFDFNLALNVALPLAWAAYSPTDAKALPAGWSLVSPIKLDGSLACDPFSHLCPKEPLGSPFGIVAQNGDTTAVCFRGTTMPIEWTDDFDSALKDGAEAGFGVVYSALEHSLPVPSTGKVLIIGHSLGAALALLYAWRHSSYSNLEVYSFAGPRVFDKGTALAFDAAVPECYRIVNRWDIVPRLPTALMGYRHAGTPVDVDSGFEFAKQAHGLTAYGNGLKALQKKMAASHQIKTMLYALK